VGHVTDICHLSHKYFVLSLMTKRMPVVAACICRTACQPYVKLHQYSSHFTTLQNCRWLAAWFQTQMSALP